MKNNILELFQRKNTSNYINRPYIIAEIGVNHEGCITTAKRLVEEAKEGGLVREAHGGPTEAAGPCEQANRGRE